MSMHVVPLGPNQTHGLHYDEEALLAFEERLGLRTVREALDNVVAGKKPELAAAALFWLCHKLRRGVEANSARGVLDCFESLGTGGRDGSGKAAPLVKVLVGAASLYLLDPDSEDFEPLVDKLAAGSEHVPEVTRTTRDQLRPLNFGDDGFLVRFSALSAAAVARHEKALSLRRTNEFEESFLQSVAGWDCIFRVDCEPWFDLPSTGYCPMQWDAQDLLDEIRTDSYRPKVKDWSALIAALERFSGDVDWDHSVSYQAYPGANKLEVDLLVYLEFMRIFMLGQKALQEAFVELERVRNGYHQRRLELDFFHGIWEDLSADTREALVQAEHCWYDASKQGGRPMAAMNELRLAFERELHSALFRHVSADLNRLMESGKLREELRLGKEASGETLGLRQMATLVEEAGQEGPTRVPPLKRLIEQRVASKPDRHFLYRSLPFFLRKLAKARREPEHRVVSATESNVESQMRQLRGQALGIGEEGYLARIAAIKRAMTA